MQVYNVLVLLGFFSMDIVNSMSLSSKHEETSTNLIVLKEGFEMNETVDGDDFVKLDNVTVSEEESCKGNCVVEEKVFESRAIGGEFDF